MPNIHLRHMTEQKRSDDFLDLSPIKVTSLSKDYMRKNQMSGQMPKLQPFAVPVFSLPKDPQKQALPQQKLTAVQLQQTFS